MVRLQKRPETIENRWDILYAKYPEVYDAFSRIPYTPNVLSHLLKLFSFRKKVVVDIGSGTGRSTFPIARQAKEVVGIEPEDAMRKLAVREAKKKRIKNVTFVKGSGQRIPLKEHYADIILAVTALPPPEKMSVFLKECKRVLKKGGLIISVDIAPKWYGGDLAPVILGKSRMTNLKIDEKIDTFFRHHNFLYKDVYSVQEYESVKRMVDIYGFIFGKKAIAHIKKTKRTCVKWKVRIHYARF
ncbi:MAG: class I SAM-dependent methyltransferase [Nanoarchaeota archaeon]